MLGLITAFIHLIHLIALKRSKKLRTVHDLVVAIVAHGFFRLLLVCLILE